MKIWAAVYGAEKTPELAVYGTDKRKVEMAVSDRQANGEAFEGEQVTWFASPAAYFAACEARHVPRSPSCVQYSAAIGGFLR